MNNHLRTALRWVVYIRTMSGEPVPFHHGSHLEWALHLQRQHERLRRAMAPELARTAKASAKDLIRRNNYRATAEEATPIPGCVPDAQHGSEASSAGQEGAIGTEQMLTAKSPSNAWSPDASCRRKLRHPDLWSALVHARRLGGGVRVYICDCGGAHVGHPPNDRTREYRKARRRLKVIERRLVSLDRERGILVEEKNELLRQIGEPDLLRIMISGIAKQVLRAARIFGA